ncbi:MAG TPA: urea carboxylase-associated family protein [Thermomicrobiales bacterium]|nr:urea carboxylase-associated family protein [Thermomicrobiales bacterium]
MTISKGPLAGRMARRAMQIRPNQAGVFDVKADQFLQITDMMGKQVATMVAFNLHDLEEYLSPANTRALNRSMMLTRDHALYTNRNNKIFSILEDAVGRHDILLPPCDAQMYRDNYGIENHFNCMDNFHKALKSRGIEHDRIPDGVNWFMNVGLKARGELEVREPISERNDAVILRANMDALVAICASPNDQSACNGFKPTDILIRVYM